MAAGSHSQSWWRQTTCCWGPAEYAGSLFWVRSQTNVAHDLHKFCHPIRVNRNCKHLLFMCLQMISFLQVLRIVAVVPWTIQQARPILRQTQRNQDRLSNIGFSICWRRPSWPLLRPTSWKSSLHRFISSIDLGLARKHLVYMPHGQIWPEVLSG